MSNSNLVAQTCEQMLEQAQAAERRGAYFDAYKKYNAALSHCHDALREKIEQKIQAAVKQLEQQRERAETAEHNIKMQRDVILSAKEDAEKAEARATNNLERAEKLLRFFNFDGEKAAWAYQNGKFAVVNLQGDTLSDFIYESPEPFQKGVAVASTNNQVVFIDSTGKVISSQYDFLAKSIGQTYIGMRLGQKKLIWGRADKTYNLNASWNNLIPKEETPWTYVYGDSLQDLVGLIKKGGDQIIQPMYESISPFYRGTALVLKQRKCGMIDTNGITVAPLVFDQILHFKDSVTVMSQQNKFGLIDYKGNIVVPPSYEFISMFSEGLAGFKNGGKWGFLDTRGNIVVPAKYSHISHHFEGMAAVELNKKWGYLDTAGKEIVALQYDKVGDFSEGLGRVYKGLKYGFVDQSGKEVIPIQYEEKQANSTHTPGITPQYNIVFGNMTLVPNRSEYDFLNGCAQACAAGGCGIIDPTGNMVIPVSPQNMVLRRNGDVTVVTKYLNTKGKVESFILDRNGRLLWGPRNAYVSSLGNGLGQIMTADGLGVIDGQGKLLTKHAYERIENYYNGFAAVQRAGLWGLIDTNGNETMPCKFETVGKIENNSVWVSQDGVYNFVRPNGEPLTVVAPKNDYANLDPQQFIFYAQKNKKWVLNSKFQEIIPPGRYDYISNFNDGVAIVNIGGIFGMGYPKQGSKYGLVDTCGKVVLPLIFDEIRPQKEGLFAVRKNDKWGFANLRGGLSVSPLYHKVSDFNEGRAVVKLEKKFGVIDSTGRWVFKPKFDSIRPYKDGFAAVSIKRIGNKKWVATSKIGALFIYLNIFNRPLKYRYPWGFIDKYGKTVLKPTYTGGIGDFTKGWATFGTKRKAGFIDTLGNIVVPPQYARRDNDDMTSKVAVVRDLKDNQISAQQWLIDRLGKKIFDKRYDNINVLSNGLIAIEEGQKWALANDKGKLLSAFDYDKIEGANDSLCFITFKNQFGVMNSDGKIVIAPDYNFIRLYKNNLLIVHKNAKYGLINLMGNEIIAFQYENPQVLSNGLWFKHKYKDAGIVFQQDKVVNIPHYDQIQRTFGKYWVVKKGNKEGLVDSLWREVLPCQFNKIEQVGVDIFLPNQNGLIGLYAPRHEMKIKPNYEQVGLPGEANNWLRVRQNGKWGWVDQSGGMVIPCIFDATTPFQNGKALVRQAPYPDFFYVNMKGEMLLSIN